MCPLCEGAHTLSGVNDETRNHARREELLRVANDIQGVKAVRHSILFNQLLTS
jgi:hypothetical protein